MSIIAFVPVRSGSKSIKNKNIKILNGKPLFFWVLNALENAREINKIILATDSDAYAEIAKSFNFSKLEIYARNPENANDTASTESVVLEYLEKANLNNQDIFVLAQATSPLTRSEDFDNALGQFIYSGNDSMLSCVKSKRFFWDKDANPINYDYKKRPRRQDFDGMFMENGAFYINKVENILKDKNRLSGNIGIYEMPEYSAIEIDEAIDWKIVEVLLAEQNAIKRSQISDIKLFMSDVDGVLTDAGMYYSENGDELKKFCTHDGMGIKLLKEKGLKVGIITTEDRQLNRNRANKLKLDYHFHGETNKLETIKNLCKELNISLSEVAYIGDDVNDFELLSAVGLAACPANSVEKIKNIPNIIHLSKKGGEGAVREFVEIVVSI
ncbi:MAG: N-acylneuraminate cytidylyltransferase [Bacteroidales bacterium]|jgi:N-acylneuraminate cytidylyltransferase|nr:N-acylneuraminate cytidylyltransferase [Bacteroidales bacterium]MCK9498364.1 N-acylneuraminate cytidylyltransferase [Bacteroidales bacterium]MDY0314934.1 N-acylneuraminate cytidylyltransferase [Bacteroidales bacterium]NLB86629.1 N-acylneuraminate cytidylyltransferase [Bacteroidales bacterium]